MEDAASLDLECARVEFFQLLVGCIECDVVDIICDGECFNVGFEFCYFLFGRCDDKVDCVYLRWFSLAPDKVDVDVCRYLDVAFGNGLQECRLRCVSQGDDMMTQAIRTFPDPFSPRRPYRCP